MSSTEMNRNAMTYNENHMIFQFTIRNDLYIYKFSCILQHLRISLLISNTVFHLVYSNHSNEAYSCV